MSERLKKSSKNAKKIMDIERQYKKPPSTFGNMIKIRASISHKIQDGRKKCRTQEFEKIREIEDNKENKTENGRQQSSMASRNKDQKKLLEWKTEREKKKNQEKLSKRPPFKVGIVHHRVYSPVTSTNTLVPVMKKKPMTQIHTKPNVKMRITKATQKRLAQKAANVEKPVSPDSIENCQKSKKKIKSENEKINFSYHLQSGNLSTSENFQLESGTLVSKEGEEYTVQHFKYLLHAETERLRKLCEEWTEVQSQYHIAEEAQQLISQTIGQTNLLLNEKFQHFGGLVLNYERGGGNLPVYYSDLQGFWDLMCIEVKDCNSRFMRLEKLRANRWQEDEEKPTFTKFHLESIAKKKKKLVKKSVAQTRQGLLQDFILVERRKKKIREMQRRRTTKIANDSDLILNTFSKCVTPSISDKKFEIPKQSLNASQNRRTLDKCSKIMYTSTPAHNSINARTFHRLNSPLITMKISQLYNKSTLQLENMMQYMTPNQTPRLNIIAKPSRSKKSISLKLTPGLQQDDSLISVTLRDEELEKLSEKPVTNSDARRSSKKVELSTSRSALALANINKPRAVECVRAEEESSFYTSPEKSYTFKWLQYLNKESTRAEEKNDTFPSSLYDSDDITFMNCSFNKSQKDLREESFVRTSKSQTMNENVEFFHVTESVENIFSTPRIAKNCRLRKISIDELYVTKNHEASVKILRNESISFVDTPKNSKRTEIISTNEESIVRSEDRSSANDETFNLRDMNEATMKITVRNDFVHVKSNVES